MNNKYPLTFWYGIPAAFICRERVEEAKNAGFNIIECCYDRDTNKKVLGWCEELGVHAFVYDSRMGNAFAGTDGWENGLISMIDDYSDCPALERWFVKDEPVDSQFPALARVCDFMREHDAKHGTYINLLPLVAILPAENYIAHVKNYLKTVRPSVLSYDHYNLMKREVPVLTRLPEARVSDECRERNHWENKIFEAWDREGFYDNLEIIKDCAKEAGIPWMNIILLIEHWHYRRPTEGEVRWEVFTSFAYGSALVSYFTYWTPGVGHNEPWSYHHGIIGADGVRDENYEIVRGINSEIQSLYSTLDGDEFSDMFHIGHEDDKLVKTFTGYHGVGNINAVRALAGFFGNDKFIVVNKLHHEKQVIGFESEHKIAHFNKSTLEWEQLGENSYEFAPGDGELFRVLF